MAVVVVAQWQPNPGKAQELLQDAAKVSQIAQRHGARGARVFQALFAGPNSGIISHVFEFDDLAGFASFQGKFEADPEFQQLFAKATGANAPATLLSVSLLREVATQ